MPPFLFIRSSQQVEKKNLELQSYVLHTCLLRPSLSRSNLKQPSHYEQVFTVGYAAAKIVIASMTWLSESRMYTFLLKLILLIGLAALPSERREKPRNC